MFVLVAMVIFSVAMYIAAYYVWTVPQQQAEKLLAARMRELRAHTRGGRDRKAPGLMRQEQRGTFAFLGDLVTWVGVLRRLQELIDQANLKYRAADVFGGAVLLGGLAFAIMTVTGGTILLRVLIAFMVGLVPVFYIVQVRGKRLRKFEAQLPDAIDLFTRTMRAGHNIHSGLETIANETADPVRMEFRKLMEELALGSQVEPALHGLGKRVPLIDLKFFIITLILQRQTGANMVSVLEGLSTLVRERLGMAAKLKAHTAQQRFSAGILCALPIVFGLGCWFLKPDYIRPLWTDELGSKIFTFAIIWELIGILVIRRISSIRV
ncbi:Type II secretion system protein [Candidatus Sulfopaludibacter sp. SbA3]|nr:Type II secretion system protein [Candidatus Sulfopaludibacter sp. SbA3]